MSKAIALLATLAMTMVFYYLMLIVGLGLEVKSWFWLVFGFIGLCLCELLGEAIVKEE